MTDDRQGPPLPASDHDLLIRVDTTLSHVRDDLKGLTDTVRDDITALKRDKVDHAEMEAWKKDSYTPLEQRVNGHDETLKWQSRAIWMGMGALALLEILLKWGSVHSS